MKIENTKMQEKFNLSDIQPESVVRMTLAGYPNNENRYIAVKSGDEWFIAPGEESTHTITHTAMVEMTKNGNDVVVSALELDPYAGSGELSNFEKEYNTKFEIAMMSKEWIKEFSTHFSPEYYIFIPGIKLDDDAFVVIGYKRILHRDLTWIACKFDPDLHPWHETAAKFTINNSKIIVEFGDFDLYPINYNKEEKKMKETKRAKKHHRPHPMKAIRSTAGCIGSSFIWGVKHPIKAVKKNAGHVASIPHNIKCAITHK